MCKKDTQTSQDAVKMPDGPGVIPRMPIFSHTKTLY